MPKALVEIGGRPILWHVIGIYAAQGFDRFLLATGYLGEMIEEFVGAERWPAGVEVECVDTGARHADRRAGQAASSDRVEAGTFCATYADGVADIDLGGRCSASTARHGDLATVTVVRPHLSGASPSSTTATGSTASSRSRGSSTGSTAASSASSPGSLDYLDEDSVLEREPLDAARRRRAAARLPPRGLLGLHGHLQGRGRAQRPLGGGRGAVAGLGRRALGTPPTGERRGWPIGPCSSPAATASSPLALARALLERGDEVVAFDRASPGDSDPGRHSGLALLGIEGEVELVEATCATPTRSTRHLDARASRRRLPPRGPDDRRHGRRVAGGRPSTSTCAAPGRCSRPAATHDVSGGRRRLLRQGLRRPRRAALPRGLRRCSRRLPTRQQGGGRPDRPQLLARPTGCRSRSPASPTSTAAATSTSRA